MNELLKALYDSFIAGFHLAWRLSNELNMYEKTRPMLTPRTVASMDAFIAEENEGGRKMAAYTFEEIFNGNKYSVMSEVVKELLLSGPYESAEDEQTAIEMVYVKHTILVLREMEKNGDTVKLIP